MSTQVPAARPTAMLDWVTRGTAVFETAVDHLGDPRLVRPSRLPGWSRAHVVAHVARNADALVNLLTWARTGVETPMYSTPEQRVAEIEAGAHLPVDDLRADLRAADRRLADAVAALPDACWNATVRTAQRRLVPTAEVAWLRVREVWVHAVDLDGEFTFDAVPREICAALLDNVAAASRSRADVPSVALQAADDDRVWTLGAVEVTDVVTVRGGTACLAAYATGRPVPGALETTTGGPVPALPRWL